MNFETFTKRIAEFEKQVDQTVSGKRGYVLAKSFNGIGQNTLDKLATQKGLEIVRSHGRMGRQYQLPS